jgi:HK97 family phage portal protein
VFGELQECYLGGGHLERRNLFNKIFGNKKTDNKTIQRFELISDSSNAFQPWSGNAFDSDIVRSAIRPKANAVGKLNPKHIRGEGSTMKINPDSRIKTVLQFPNPYMSMQDMLMKLTYHRELNHNAFAYVKKDSEGYPVEIYPVPFSNMELLEVAGDLYVKFWFKVGKTAVIPYENMIHLRKDFNSNDIFGDTGKAAMINIMDVITTTDKGIVNAVKNSAILKWVMTFKAVARPSDVQEMIDIFVKNYLDPSTSKGVAPADPRYDLKQVENKEYVPNAAQMDRTVQRLYSYFGVNDAIVQNKYTEDQWNAFYESEIEPIAIQLSNAFTRAFFTAREIGFGNRIIFEANSLQYASMATKLKLTDLVDRGIMTPNQVCEVLNLPPVVGGDIPIRRLDTAPVDKTGKTDEGGQDDGKQSTGKD